LAAAFAQRAAALETRRGKAKATGDRRGAGGAGYAAGNGNFSGDGGDRYYTMGGEAVAGGASSFGAKEIPVGFGGFSGSNLGVGARGAASGSGQLKSSILLGKPPAERRTEAGPL
jgi:hypothetical protein